MRRSRRRRPGSAAGCRRAPRRAPPAAAARPARRRLARRRRDWRRGCRRSSPHWHRRSASRPARPRAPRRCASGSPSPPSLILSSARWRALAAACGHRGRRAERDREGGGHRRGAGRPASSCTARPLRLASRSQNAQSSALRAAPGGMACCRPRGRGRPRARPHRLDRRADALDALAIARIGHAFAAARACACRRRVRATTTTASVLAPRLMAKEPAIGQRSTARVRVKGRVKARILVRRLGPKDLGISKDSGCGQTLDRFMAWVKYGARVLPRRGAEVSEIRGLVA